MSTTTSSSSSSSDQLPLLSSNQQIFSDFFDCWISQIERDLRPLYAMVGSQPATTQPPPAAGGLQEEEEADDESQTRRLVDRVIGHYEYYVRGKTALARCDVLPMFTPTWTSSTDNLFLWVGGYRPSTAFHVLYSKSGLNLDFHLASLCSGHDVGTGPGAGDLADLSHSQINRIDALQRDTIRREKEISEEEAAAQESVASPKMVTISHEVTETAMSAMGDGGEGQVELSAMDEDMKRTRERMAKVLEKADTLRLDTLKGIVAILRPVQAVHFLIASFELLLRVHEFGKSTDYAARLRAAQRTKSAVF